MAPGFMREHVGMDAVSGTAHVERSFPSARRGQRPDKHPQLAGSYSSSKAASGRKLPLNHLIDTTFFSLPSVIAATRSEERRVGKGCRVRGARWSARSTGTE